MKPSTEFESSPLSSSPSLSISSISSYSSSLSSSSSIVSTWKHVTLAILLITLYTTSLGQACFIRNCPKGGKRSMEPLGIGQRPCMSCGPGNAGQCVGPRICCSSHFGCHFGTPETDVCGKENESTTPCYVVGDVCGTSGKCVAPGICCDDDSCTESERCRYSAAQEPQDKGKLLRLIQRLLQTKNLD